jgi:hypothetical protein
MHLYNLFMQKFIRIFLLVLIIIGVAALATQKFWVPRLVNKIISSEVSKQPIKTVSLLTADQIAKMDLIKIYSPRPNTAIQSPLVVTGTARGSWFFEGSFPVTLVDWDGLIIGEGIAKTNAGANWMTKDFVPFTATLTFKVNKKAYSNKGTLILRKDNPSGLPQNNDSLEIPVVFKE